LAFYSFSSFSQKKKCFNGKSAATVGVFEQISMEKHKGKEVVGWKISRKRQTRRQGEDNGAIVA
jgi:hypothetical protein